MLFMRQTIYQYPTNRLEEFILSYLYKVLSEMKLGKSFELCPIYKSEITIRMEAIHFPSEPKELSEMDMQMERDIFDDKRDPQIVITDFYGVYFHGNSRKKGQADPTILLFEKVIAEDRAKYKGLSTIVFLHEIGHYIAYNLLDSRRKAKKARLEEELANRHFSEPWFQELWAQVFTFKLLDELGASKSRFGGQGGNFASPSQKRVIARIRNEMVNLSFHQAEPYQRFIPDYLKKFNPKVLPDELGGVHYSDVSLQDLINIMLEIRSKYSRRCYLDLKKALNLD